MGDDDSVALQFDSREEVYFSWYLDELVRAGFARKWARAGTITLADNAKIGFQKRPGVKIETRVILRDQTYTPDFEVWWEERARGIFFQQKWACDGLEVVGPPPPSYGCPFISNSYADGSSRSLIEVKGGFTEHDEARIYSILAKWVLQRTGEYVQRVIVSNKGTSIFARTFTPVKYMLTDKTGKPRKIGYKVATLRNFVDAVPRAWPGHARRPRRPAWVGA